MPLYGGISAVLFFAAMGLPGMCGFIGEVMVVLSAWKFAPGGQQWSHHLLGCCRGGGRADGGVTSCGRSSAVFMGQPVLQELRRHHRVELCWRGAAGRAGGGAGVLPQLFVLNWMEPERHGTWSIRGLLPL